MYTDTYYRNNSRLTSTFNTNEFLKSALKAEKAKPDQLNLGILILSLLLLYTLVLLT